MRKINGPAIARVLVLCAVGFAVVTPFYTAYRINGPQGASYMPIITHDMAQHLAVMKQFDEVLRSGTLYPRWLPDMDRGYGAPWTNFYPVGFYYLTSLVHAIFSSWILTLFVVSGIGLAASAIAFYGTSRELCGPWPSFLAALLYTVLPYHLIDLYWRGAMPEFMVFVLVPPIFYFAYKLAGSGRALYLAAFGLCYGALTIVHTPTSLLMAYALAFFAILHAFLFKQPRAVIRIALGMVIAYGLGAIYLAPAFLESKDVYQPWTALFPYKISYLKVFRWGDDFARVLNFSVIGCGLLLVAAIVAIVALPDLSERKVPPIEEKAEGKAGGKAFGEKAVPTGTRSRQIGLVLVMGIGAVFMSTSASRFVSRFLPEIDVASFAWRWLAIASFFVCLALAASLDRLLPRLKARNAPAVFIAFLIAAAVGVNLWFAGHSIAARALAGPVLDPPRNFQDLGFTPKDAAHPDSLPLNAPEAELVPNNGYLWVDEWSPTVRRFTATVLVSCDLRIRTYNFPGWTASLDGGTSAILNDDLGAQTIHLSPGNHQIVVDFKNTRPRLEGAVASAVALMLIVGLFAFDFIRRRTRQPAPAPPNTVEAV